MGALVAVSLAGISKTFPGTRALSDVSLELLPGEVHALIGQNGSGKSTLFKILAGVHAPDPGGKLHVGGREVPLPINSRDLPSLGFSFVHQDLGLAERVTVLENTRIGYFEAWRLGPIDWDAERCRVREALASFGARVSPDALVEDLSQVDRAMVAIARAFQAQGDEERTLLVLDEPTSYLPAVEVARLFEAVRAIARRGVAVLLTTHRLSEVKQIADRVSVLRDGRLVGTFGVAETTEEDLIMALVGQRLGDLYPDIGSAGGEEDVLRVEGIGGHGVEDVTFGVRRGEVLGVTGLVGMGYDRLPYVIYGALPPTTGTIALDGRRYAGLRPRQAMKLGLGLLPANRHGESGLQSAPLRENVTMPLLGSFFRGGRLRRRREQRSVRSLLGAFEVRPRPDPELLLSSLSGGNQQKVLLAKWLQIPALRVLMLHEPTQGVDVGSRKAIFRLIRETAAAGTAVLLASAEYADLAHLCDRALVMQHGRVVAELTGERLTEERIVEQCYRTSTRAAA